MEKINPLDRPKIGITIGDINGIGIEVIIKTFSDDRLLNYCTPIIYGSSRALSYHRKVLQTNDFNYNIINSAERSKPNVCNVLNCWTEEIQINIGRPDPKLSTYTFRALESASYDLGEGKIDAIVTAPVNKKLLNNPTTAFSGHTEYLAAKFGVKENLMLLVNDTLRVGLVTNHLPISKVAENITKERIINKLKIMNKSLRQDFGVIRPRIAVLGLNPHAGDTGLIGEEEQKIITPAIEAVKSREKMLVFGPYSADGFFGMKLDRQFDAVLAMYHDQGLVPFKALSFGHGVNFTAGMPIVRTSPDHGTAYDIAGKSLANPDSFRQSIYLALDVLRHRKNYAEITANPLEQQHEYTTET